MIADFLVECDCCGWVVLSTAPCKCTLEEASQCVPRSFVAVKSLRLDMSVAIRPLALDVGRW